MFAGAPCAGATVCRPPRADSTVGLCLPLYWGNTINQAGAGSSYGGVTGPWVGGVQGPNGQGVYVGSSGTSSPPPPPPPRTPTATLRPVRHMQQAFAYVAHALSAGSWAWSASESVHTVHM